MQITADMSDVTLPLFLMYFQNDALVLSRFLVFLVLEKLVFIENEAA